MKIKMKDYTEIKINSYNIIILIFVVGICKILIYFFIITIQYCIYSMIITFTKYFMKLK